MTSIFVSMHTPKEVCILCNDVQQLFHVFLRHSTPRLVRFVDEALLLSDGEDKAGRDLYAHSICFHRTQQVKALLEHVEMEGGVLDCCGATTDAVSAPCSRNAGSK